MIPVSSLMTLNARKFTAKGFPSVLSRCIALKPIAVASTSTGETHDERNKRFKRPLSPHLQIYQPQLTSILSVTHRGTGIALTSYAAGLAYLSFTAGDVASSVAAIHNLGIPSFILFVLKAGVAYPFTFHFANGIRHLIWDMGKALTIKGVYSTGYAVVVSSAVLAVVLACL